MSINISLSSFGNLGLDTQHSLGYITEGDSYMQARCVHRYVTETHKKNKNGIGWVQTYFTLSFIIHYDYIVFPQS